MSPPSSSVSSTSAEAVVRAFYVAHSEGREADAFAMGSAVYRADETTANYAHDTQWRRDLRIVDVGQAGLPDASVRDYYRALLDVRLVTVDFFQEHNAPARDRGRTLEFVYVGKETPYGPWRILSTNTGP